MKLLNYSLWIFCLSTAFQAIPRTENQKYIVKLKSLKNLEQGNILDNHLKWLNTLIEKVPFSETNENKLLYKYDKLGSFKGYSVQASADVADLIKKNEQVEYVEEDKVMSIDGGGATGPIWNLDRVDQRDLPLDQTYNANNTGSGITIYVIDTGIDVNNQDFEGRASLGASFVEEDAMDYRGHGTHVAGTAGGKKFGVAPGANLVAVKVLTKDGKGDASGIIAGINWVAANATPGKSVATMSLGGEFTQSVNDAVNAAAAKNIPFTASAGNSRASPTCTRSPSSAEMAFTVGACDRSDVFVSTYSAGPCISMIAPGWMVQSSWIENKLLTLSGTSMATPHVAGAFAILLSRKNYSNVKELYAELIDMSTKDKITKLPEDTVNRLLYID